MTSSAFLVPDLRAFVRSGDTVLWGQAAAEPVLLTQALLAQRADLGPLRAFIGMTWADVLQPAHADHVRFLSYCGSARNRELARVGALDVWPGHYSELPSQLAAGTLRADVLMLQVAPADADGYHSLSTACEYLSAAIETARCILVEVNAQAPRTAGPVRLAPERIALAVHSDRPLPDAPAAAGSPVEQAVARRVAALIDDGCTLQCGLGSLPEAVLRELGDRRDLGLHSGAMTDGAARPAQAGVLTNARKGLDLGVSVAGVLMGTRIVREHAHCNPAVELHPTGYTHGLEVISRIERFVAINSAIEVDLSGQINAETATGSYVGAVGGAVDFLRGAARSRGGLPIVALPSRTAPRSGAPVSRIVAHLGGPVSTARSDAGLVVTEYGVADLRGQTLTSRLRRLLDIAHPDDRERLERQAHRA